MNRHAAKDTKRTLPFVLFVSFVVLAGAATAAGERPVVREEQVHGRPAWVLDSGALRVALLRSGGHIAEVSLIAKDERLALNPMYVPEGAGYMGHIVCFPHFGPASPEERQHGLRGHGEAAWVEWQQTKPPQVDVQGITFFYGAELPKTQYRIERAVSLRAGETVVRVEEWIENLAPYDRPYNRDQHATFGAPFVAPGKNVLDMSGGRAVSDPRRTGGGQWPAGEEFDWPRIRSSGAAGEISLREFRAVPGGQVYTPVLTKPVSDVGWFTLYNTDYPLVVGYMFPAAEHPWIVDWQNRPKPDTTAGTARGIEFGTSPFDEGLRRSVERAAMFAAPTYAWIGARQRLASSFTIFVSEVPAGFAGVHDVQVDDGTIVIVERESRRPLRIPHRRN